VASMAVKNSAHYGIAGFYASIAADAGCIRFCGTNARSSISFTFGVEPMLGKKILYLAQSI
jgi:L-2-hydroxycarboxylate dehydrogenase (NAD+)